MSTEFELFEQALATYEQTQSTSEKIKNVQEFVIIITLLMKTV